MKRTPEIVLVGLVSALLLTQFGQCMGRSEVHSEVALNTAHRLAKSLRPYRDSVSAIARKVDTVRTSVGRAGEGVSVADQSLTQTLDSVHAMLANEHATNAELRIILLTSAERSESLQVAVRRYQSSVDSLLAATFAERLSRQALQAQSDSTIRAYQSAVAALDCRVLGLKCPSRTMSAGLGGLVALLLVLTL